MKKHLIRLGIGVGVIGGFSLAVFILRWAYQTNPLLLVIPVVLGCGYYIGLTIYD